MRALRLPRALHSWNPPTLKRWSSLRSTADTPLLATATDHRWSQTFGLMARSTFGNTYPGITLQAWERESVRARERESERARERESVRAWEQESEREREQESTWWDQITYPNDIARVFSRLASEVSYRRIADVRFTAVTVLHDFHCNQSGTTTRLRKRWTLILDLRERCVLRLLAAVLRRALDSKWNKLKMTWTYYARTCTYAFFWELHTSLHFRPWRGLLSLLGLSSIYIFIYIYMCVCIFICAHSLRLNFAPFKLVCTFLFPAWSKTKPLHVAAFGPVQTPHIFL